MYYCVDFLVATHAHWPSILPCSGSHIMLAKFHWYPSTVIPGTDPLNAWPVVLRSVAATWKCGQQCWCAPCGWLIQEVITPDVSNNLGIFTLCGFWRGRECPLEWPISFSSQLLPLSCNHFPHNFWLLVHKSEKHYEWVHGCLASKTANLSRVFHMNLSTINEQPSKLWC